MPLRMRKGWFVAAVFVTALLSFAANGQEFSKKVRGPLKSSDVGNEESASDVGNEESATNGEVKADVVAVSEVDNGEVELKVAPIELAVEEEVIVEVPIGEAVDAVTGISEDTEPAAVPNEEHAEDLEGNLAIAEGEVDPSEVDAVIPESDSTDTVEAEPVREEVEERRLQGWWPKSHHSHSDEHSHEREEYLRRRRSRYDSHDSHSDSEDASHYEDRYRDYRDRDHRDRERDDRDRNYADSSRACYECDTDYWGDDVKKIENGVADLKSCQRLCKDHPLCRYFTYVDSWGGCYLKSSKRGSERETAKILVSGKKHCDGHGSIRCHGRTYSW